METEAVQPLINRAKELFTKVFGGEAEIITSAPGRLNFGGEHCDYMGGYVLPFPTILSPHYKLIEKILVIFLVRFGSSLFRKNNVKQHKRLELENGVIFVSISEITVIALLRSTPGMAQSNWTAFS